MAPEQFGKRLLEQEWRCCFLLAVSERTAKKKSKDFSKKGVLKLFSSNELVKIEPARRIALVKMTKPKKSSLPE